MLLGCCKHLTTKNLTTCLLGLTWSCLDPSPAYAVKPAAGGQPLLRAAESAVTTVVGRVDAPADLDTHGYHAALAVEQVVAGQAQVGERLRIGWEELSPRRPVRFHDGERVLLALDPLPAASLWRQRFAAYAAERVLVVAAAGDAFVREPDPPTVALLATYLALPPAQRLQTAGVDGLASLVARAATPVAVAGLERLAAVGDLDRQLGEPAGAALIGAAADATRPRPVRAGVLDLIARKELRRLRPRLTPLAGEGSDLEADALAAIGVLDGGLPPAQVDALLARRDAEVRAVGARFARGATLERKLPALARSDPAPCVRAAAALTLVRHGGSDGLTAAFPALADPDASVRGPVAQAIGALGAPVVPVLQAAVRTRPLAEAKGMIVALSLAGPTGKRALAEIAATHPSEEVRTLARLGLGHLPSEH